MPSPRTSVPTSDLQADVIDWAWFFKLTIGGIYGTKRYTDYAKTSTFTGNIDGGSATWNDRPLSCGGFNQDNAGVESVQYIEIGDIDWELATAGADVGLMGVAYELWVGWFAKDGVTIDGSYLASTGLVDDVQYGQVARLTLKANNTYWSRRILGPPLGPLCPFYFKDADTCQYVGVDTKCLKTRTDCTGRTGGSNVAHFGGFDLALAPNTILYFQQWQITAGGGSVPVTPPSSPPTPPPITVPVQTNDPGLHHNHR